MVVVQRRSGSIKIARKIRSFITRLKLSRTQRRIYDEVTVASTVLLDEQRAASEIVRCVEACLRHKRPVYIEVPHDIVDREIPITGVPLAAPENPIRTRSRRHFEETISLDPAQRRNRSFSPASSWRVITPLVWLCEWPENVNIPIAADLLSKSAVPENHRSVPRRLRRR